MNNWTNLSHFVTQMLMDADSTVELTDIYDKVENFFALSAIQKEATRYHEFRFHHEVRAILNQLVQSGQVIRVGGGIYRKA